MTLEPPVLVTVSDNDGSDPTVTLPKPRLVGLGVNSPAVSVPVPVPKRLTVAVLEALLVIVAVALKVPAALGANVTLTWVLCPSARDSGRLGEFREKYLVEKVTLLIVTVPGPEFVTVAERVSLLPAATLPKFRVPFVMDRVPVCTWTEAPALMPWQPARKARAATRSKATATFPRCFE